MSEKLVITINASAPEKGKKADRREDSRAAGPKEVVVYHWGRIGLALAVLVVVGLFGTWKLSERHESRISGVPTPSTPAPADVERPAAGGATRAALTPVTTTSAPVPINVPDKVQAATSQAVTLPEHETVASAIPVAPAKPAANAVTADATKERRPAQPLSSDRAPKVSAPEIPAKVSILSHHIARAQLTSQLKDKLPTDRLGAVIPLNGRALIKVYFYTELKGLKHRRIYYRWYHDGKVVARIAIRPYIDDMNASSSKYITPRMTGHWHILVSDDRGHSLAEANFEVR